MLVRTAYWHLLDSSTLHLLPQRALSAATSRRLTDVSCLQKVSQKKRTEQTTPLGIHLIGGWVIPDCPKRLSLLQAACRLQHRDLLRHALRDPLHVENKQTRKDYTFLRHFNEKPSDIPGCPEPTSCTVAAGSADCGCPHINNDYSVWPAGWCLPDRGHCRHPGEHCGLQTIQARVSGLRVQVWRHVE